MNENIVFKKAVAQSHLKSIGLWNIVYELIKRLK